MAEESSRPLILESGEIKELPNGRGLVVQPDFPGQFLCNFGDGFHPAQILVNETDWSILIDETTGQVIVDG